MKQLVCEMCGSTNIVKQDGMFVCQTCGTKYSVDEAKKMMIEGQVDVTGSTVKVDNSASIENYFKLAESAYESSNQSEAEKYCNKIIEIEPNNCRAWFLKGKAAGWQSTLANLRIEESVNCFSNAIDYAPEEEQASLKEQAANEIESLSTAMLALSCDNYEQFPDKDNAEAIVTNLKLAIAYSIMLLDKCGVVADGFKELIATRITNAALTAWENVIYREYISESYRTQFEWHQFMERGLYAIALIQTAIDIYDDDDEQDIDRYKIMISMKTSIMNSYSTTISDSGYYVPEFKLNDDAKARIVEDIMGWHQKIKEIDPEYVIPEKPTPSTGGCYVATAVYGSYDCPEVWTLRRYRDYVLAETWYGRAFIHTYYAISPTLVDWFGNAAWFKKIWRGKLDRMVKNLQGRGFESTPYKDREW